MGYKSETQFFHDADVHEWLTALASATSITIFAGAGLTIDRTNLGWRDLVRKVLAKQELSEKGYIDPAGADLVADHLAPVESATIAEHYFGMLFDDSEEGSEEGRSALMLALQGELYPGSYWRAGNLTRNVLVAAIDLASARKDVRIVTTNYETHLEDQYQALIDEAGGAAYDTFPRLRVQVMHDVLRHLGPTKSLAPEIELTYLHGRVPNRGDIRGDVALSEHDYYRLRRPVTRYLRDAFRGRTVAIVGASLTDPPLLSALEDTAMTGRRLALTPMPAYGFYKKLDDDRIATLKKHLQARMDEFDVRLLFPDFYFQLGQFFQELRVAVLLAEDSDYATGTPEFRYGGRLTGWWQRWADAHLAVPRAEHRAHAAVTRGLHDVLESLSPRDGVFHSKDEPLRMEVWVRWNPSEENRCLALWARSSEINKDPHNPTLEPLDNLSPVPAMKAFVEGRAAHIVGDGGRSFGSAQSYLAIPITHDDVPVGVVSLSSAWGKHDTRLHSRSAREMSAVIRGMRAVGRQMFGLSTLPDRQGQPG